MKKIKLGINIDHVATLRQARLGTFPSPRQAALEAVRGGADGITIHLREDRRHIQDADLPAIHRAIKVPLNLEMAIHSAIVKIALKERPEKVCMVPEKRQELTTEGGLNVIVGSGRLQRAIPELRSKGIEVSLFIAPDLKQIRKAAELGADAIEIHTGAYAEARGGKKKAELAKIQKAAQFASSLGLIVNAGHGLDYDNVKPLVKMPEFEEFNIGHSIVSQAVFVGLKKAVRDMKTLLRR